MTVKIDLGGGLVAVVDDTDAELARQRRWHPISLRGKTYAATRWYANGKRRRLTLHHAIIGSPRQVVFVNSNTLDCRRANLRLKSERKPAVRSEMERPKARDRMTAEGFRSWCLRLDLSQKEAAETIG